MAASKQVTWVCSKCGHRVAGTSASKPAGSGKCPKGTATRPLHSYIKG